MARVPGTRSAYAERVAGSYFLDFVLRRDRLERYGLSIDDANTMVITAVGGDNQGVTVEGRERYGIKRCSACCRSCGRRAPAPMS